MEIYLLRHGETESNRQRRYQGWSESPLSGEGRRQAAGAAAFLAGRNIQEVHCSDLQRASQTAGAIAAACGVAARPNPRLREIHFGAWEGLTYDEITARWGEAIDQWLADPFRLAPPGGESLKDVEERAAAFMESLVGEKPGEASTPGAGNNPARGSDPALPQKDRKVVVVSHGGTIRLLLFNLLQHRGTAFWKIRVDNASISLLGRQNGSLRVIYRNRTAHLL